MRTGGRTYDDPFEGTIGFLQVTGAVDDRVFRVSPQVWIDDTLFAEESLAAHRAPSSIDDIIDHADIPVPLLMLYSDSIDTLGEVGDSPSRPFGWNDFLYEHFETAGARDDIVRLRLDGTTHFGVTDAQLMTRDPAHRFLTDPIDAGTSLDIVNELVVGFLDQYLRDAANDFPHEPLRRHPNVLSRHDVVAIRDWWLAKTPDEQASLEQRLDEALETP